MDRWEDVLLLVMKVGLRHETHPPCLELVAFNLTPSADFQCSAKRLFALQPA